MLFSQKMLISVTLLAKYVIIIYALGSAHEKFGIRIRAVSKALQSQNFFLGWVGRTAELFQILIDNLRGCLHYTGATFAPEWVHSSSFSWLYICYMIPPQNVMLQVTPMWVHPGYCTRARVSLWYEISQRYHVNMKRLQVSVWNQSAGRLEWVVHAHIYNFESYVYFINM